MEAFKEMEMHTPCQKCGEWFDLNDGKASEKWFIQTIICSDCGEKERIIIELESDIEDYQDELEEAQDDIVSAEESILSANQTIKDNTDKINELKEQLKLLEDE